MRNNLLWLLLLALVAGGAAFTFYSRFAQGPVEPAPAPPPVSPPASEPAAPRISYPLPDVPKPQAEEDDEAVVEPPRPLPELGESDAVAKENVDDLFGHRAPAVSFIIEEVIRRLVVSVDNLPQEQIPPRFLPLEPLEGLTVVDEDDDTVYLSPRNYRRYEEHVQLLEQVDIEALVDQYVRLYPLFQEAYDHLGYPDAYFNDRLIEVVDHLLAAPAVEEPVELVQPSVMFKFADPELERLSAGHKTLIRMGPANAASVKSSLREFREALLDRVQSIEQAPGVDGGRQEAVPAE